MNNAKRTDDQIPKAADDVDEIISMFTRITDHFSVYRPTIRIASFDYLDKTWEGKFLIEVNQESNKNGRGVIEIPAYLNATVDEVLADASFQPVTVRFNQAAQKWLFDADQFPGSSKFLITLKGNITSRFLEDWIEIRSSMNPTSDENYDIYWIHAALKNVAELQELHDEFNVDRVRLDVKVGVERIFSVAIPQGIRRRIKAREELLTAIERGDRIGVLRMKYRKAARESRLKPFEISRIITDLTSGDYFREYISLNRPFQLGSVYASGFTDLLPERVNVQVFTRLNLAHPAAKGQLAFAKSRYTESIARRFEEALAKSEESERKKKSR
jgi:hypothetical protein